MRNLSALVCAWVVAASPAWAGDSADLVLRNARVFTLTENTGAVSAVAIRGERIAYVGDEKGIAAWIGTETRVIDASGLTITPGFVDSHGHLHNLGRILLEPNLIGARSIDECVERVRAYQSGMGANDWLHGRGWDQNDWTTQAFPTWRDLESTNQTPVYLDRV